jgi:hypothetical protein
MPFGSDQRPDLSGVPAELAPGRPEAGHSPPPVGSPAFRAKVRIAVWLCVAMAILSVAGFLAYSLPRLFGPVDAAPVEEPVASAPEPAVPDAAAPDPQVLEVLDEYEAVMREASQSSDLARRQHAEAMKAVEAARALAKNPDSREARATFDNAIREVQAMSEQAEHANRQ